MSLCFLSGEEKPKKASLSLTHKREKQKIGGHQRRRRRRSVLCLDKQLGKSEEEEEEEGNNKEIRIHRTAKMDFVILKVRREKKRQAKTKTVMRSLDHRL